MATEREIKAEEKAVLEKAAAYRDRLRAAAVVAAAGIGYNEALVDAIQEAIRAGEFSLTMLLQLGPVGDGEVVSHFEYLNGEETQGYHGVAAEVTLKNIGDVPIEFTAKVKPVRRRSRGAVKATVNGKPVTENVRARNVIMPGEEGTVPFGKAVTLMQRYSALAYRSIDQGREGAPRFDALREVAGSVRDNGELFEWEYKVTPIDAGPERAPVKRRAPKPTPAAVAE